MGSHDINAVKYQGLSSSGKTWTSTLCFIMVGISSVSGGASVLKLAEPST